MTSRTGEIDGDEQDSWGVLYLIDSDQVQRFHRIGRCQSRLEPFLEPLLE